MENLRFEEEGHNYYVGDTRLPSVTEIIKHGKESVDYSDIPEHILKRASEIGNEVHETIERFHKGEGDLFSPDSSVNAYVNGYKQFVRTGFYTHILSEKKLYCSCHEFAGTVDLVGRIFGSVAVLDIKTTSQKHEDSWNLQTAAYRHLVESNKDVLDGLDIDAEVEDKYVVWLNKSGNFKLEPCKQTGSWYKFKSLLEDYYDKSLLEAYYEEN